MLWEIFITAVLLNGASSEFSKVDPQLKTTFRTSSEAQIVVSFVGGNIEAVKSTEAKSFLNRAERLNSLKKILTKVTLASQK